MACEVVAINRFNSEDAELQLSEARNIDDIELRYHDVAREVVPNF